MDRRRHGTSGQFIFLGILSAILINVGLAFGILAATESRSAGLNAKIQGGDAEELADEDALLKDVNCSWREGRDRKSVQVQATSEIAAEEMVCGLEYANVFLPPMLKDVYASMSVRDGGEPDALLRSQRESCSCGQRFEVIRNIDLVVPPKLGEKREEKKLPRIANPDKDTVQNTVNPDKIPEKPPEKPPEPKEVERKKPKNPRANNPLNNPNRETNDETPEGKAHGSERGEGEGKGDPYLQAVKAQFDRSMRMPASVRESERKRLRSKVQIMISSNGVITRKKIVKKSGNPAFDNMIENVLNSYSIMGRRKLKPPPPKFQNRWVAFEVSGSGVR